jgi:enoyl-[acyl-carrier-protein] reductase (NADH)
MNYDFVAASKSVLETLIPYLAWRLKPEGVRVNGITCGLAKTDSSLDMAGGELAAFMEWHQQAIGPIPFVRTEDIASALFALCSGLLDGLNGQMLTVDDGTMKFAENRYGLYLSFLQNAQGVKS